ncbi:hypothetical protein ABIA95_000211 [Bradyrhizobium sp. LA8.1]|uniref:hypothetical protein n=1 Tax=unclassified Bradyrhizobium TaxID=2631580 RepID=UPI0033936159
MSSMESVDRAGRLSGHPITTSCSGATTYGLSRDELRDMAWTNFYRAERRLGVMPELAHERADEHAKRFDEILTNVHRFMPEAG